MSVDQVVFRPALTKVLANFSKAKWIHWAQVIGSRQTTKTKVRFTKSGARNMRILAALMEQVKWPTDKYEILAIIKPGRMLARKKSQGGNGLDSDKKPARVA